MTDPEAAFLHYWRLLAPPDLQLEHDTITPVPGRKFRLDFAHVAARVGIECQGGVYGTKQRGHTRPAKYHKDCWKLAHCLAAGWRVFWVTEEMLANDPQTFVDLVVGAMRERIRV